MISSSHLEFPRHHVLSLPAQLDVTGSMIHGRYYQLLHENPIYHQLPEQPVCILSAVRRPTSMHPVLVMPVLRYLAVLRSCDDVQCMDKCSK